MEQPVINASISEGTAVRLQPAPRQLPYAQIAWFLALLVVVYFPVLSIMVKEWAENAEMGHAFFVPLVAGYMVWNDRERIMAQPVKRCWPATLLIVWGFVQMVLGLLGAELFVSRTGFLFAVIGVIWTLAGTAVVRAMAFPLCILLFMIRIPLFVYQQLTFPLQLLASQLASSSLDLLGIPVLRNGNVMELADQKLQVIEACSGIRSLLSLTFLALVYAYIFDNRRWMRVVLFVVTIPLAIAANSVRITLTGVLSQYNKAWAEGFFHSFEGWVIFMVALAGLILVHRLICWFTPQRRRHA